MVEAMIGAVGALVILAIVFASFLALLPLLIGGVSVLATFLLVGGLTEITGVSQIVEFLIALIGLGVAIDYSLLVVSRWREERAAGRDNASAVAEAMAHAGRAVVFSGLTVAIGLLSMIVLPVPMLRSVGYGGVLVPLVSVAVAVTLLPGDPGHRRPAAGLAAAAHRAVRQPGVHRLGPRRLPPPLAGRPGRHRDPGRADAARALAAPGRARQQRAGHGRPRARRAGDADRRRRPVRGASARPRCSPPPPPVPWPRRPPGCPASTPWSLRPRPTTTGPARRSSRSSPPPRAAARPARPPSAGSRAPWLSQPHVLGVGGQGASLIDFDHAVYGNFPLMLALISVATFLLLTRAFRSVLLAAKAVVFNLVSLAAAYGVLTWVWQDGHGSSAIWGIPATGAITMWVPLMVFAFLFGLSMDYEVFILTRIREAYDTTGDARQAVIEGLGRTGRLVTSAAAILMLSFLSMSTGPETDLKILATGLGAGILIDALLIRCLLVPAMVALFGRANWWLPGRLARLLRVPVTGQPAGGRRGRPRPGPDQRRLTATSHSGPVPRQRDRAGVFAWSSAAE